MAGDTLKGLRFGVLTCSTTRTPADDASGDALASGIAAAGGTVARRALLADDRGSIGALLKDWADSDAVDVILTTGGTGLGPYDLTPEATRDAGERDVPGLAELLRLRGLERTPMAALSRGVAALRGRVLMINLPGSPRGARDGLEILQPLLGHAVAVMSGAGHSTPSLSGG